MSYRYSRLKTEYLIPKRTIRKPWKISKRHWKKLRDLERRIARLYAQAGRELQETIDAYFEQFAKRDEEMRALIGDLLKLIPVENMAMISEFSASLEVKKITAMNTNSGLNRLEK